MHKDFNEWFLEAGIQLNENQLNSRWAGIVKISDNISKEDVINLVKIFYSIPISEDLTDRYAKTFVEIDATFSRKNKRELSILAGATLAHIAGTDADHCSFIELLVRAALFGNRAPALSSIYTTIEQIMLDDMILIRESSDETQESIEDSQSKELLALLNTPDIPWGPNISQTLAQYVQSADKIFAKLKKRVDEMEKSAGIHFEDSQLLWWLTGGYSKDLQCAYNNLEKSTACLVVGKEAAELVDNFPGPSSIEGVLMRMIENCKEPNMNIDFVDVVSAINIEWKAQYIKTYSTPGLTDLLPISAALAYSENTKLTSEWVHKYTIEAHVTANEIKCLPYQYALQMFFEVLAHKCYSNYEE